jgi:glycerol-3-phosphate O-acyltransferase
MFMKLLKSLTDPILDPQNTARKPYDRQELLEQILRSPETQAYMKYLADQHDEPIESLEKKCRFYLNEALSDRDHVYVKVFMRIIDWFLSRWYTGLEMYNFEKPARGPNAARIFYTVRHTSHLDNIFLPYAIYRSGDYLPHVIGGINMNYWPLGPMARKSSGIFIRRGQQFYEDKLYIHVYRAVLEKITSLGYGVVYYPEGRFSRDGRLLEFRSGIFRILAQICVSRNVDVCFVPVYASYDSLIAAQTFVDLRKGGEIKKDGVKKLLRSASEFTKNMGKFYLNYGTPVSIRQILDEVEPDWNSKSRRLTDYLGQAMDRRSERSEKEQPAGTAESMRHRSDRRQGLNIWLDKRVSETISRRAQFLTNELVIVTPVSVLAMILFYNPDHRLDLSTCREFYDKLFALARGTAYSSKIVIPQEEFQSALKRFVSIGYGRIVKDQGQEWLVSTEEQAQIYLYNANAIKHVFMGAALVISCASGQPGAFNRMELQEDFHSKLEKMIEIYFLNWSIPEEKDRFFSRVCDSLQRLELLTSGNPPEGLWTLLRAFYQKSELAAVLDLHASAV